MPNWCDNSIYITGPKKIIKELESTGLSLQKLFPCPEELNDTISGSVGSGRKEKKCYQMQLDNNVKKYNSRDWYSWNIENWGTKWDISPDYLDVDEGKTKSKLSANFQSAWGPPLTAIKKLTQKYDKISVEFHYIETGCGFAGTYRYSPKEGEYEDYIDYQSSDELEEFAKDNNNDLAENEIQYIRDREEEEKANEETSEEAS